MGDLKKVLVHSCLQREKGHDEDNPLPPNCRCRKWVSMDVAKQLVDDGEAQYVAAFRREIDTEVPCHICGQNPTLVKSCDSCAHTGFISGKKTIVIRGEDIVFVSRLKKTPRTATIEKAHIERTNEGHKDETVRSDFYEILTVEFHGSLGAAIIAKPSNAIVKQGTPEPEDNPKLGTGRLYDYGRPV